MVNKSWYWMSPTFNKPAAEIIAPTKKYFFFKQERMIFLYFCCYICHGGIFLFVFVEVVVTMVIIIIIIIIIILPEGSIRHRLDYRAQIKWKSKQKIPFKILKSKKLSFKPLLPLPPPPQQNIFSSYYRNMVFDQRYQFHLVKKHFGGQTHRQTKANRPTKSLVELTIIYQEWWGWSWKLL